MEEPDMPVPERILTLEQLLAQITDDNRHSEVETGPAVGNEAWQKRDWRTRNGEMVLTQIKR